MTNYENTINLSPESSVESIVMKKENFKEVKVMQEDIKNVPEKERIKLDEDTIYRFSCTVDNEYLKLKLSEIGAFAPYIYEILLTLDEIKKKYKTFRSCDNLEEVKEHIMTLFNSKKIKLCKEKEDTIKFKISLYWISIQETIEIEAKRIMTTIKDDSLLKLYEIQKKQIKAIKEIEKYLQGLGQNGKNIMEKINEIKK